PDGDLARALEYAAAKQFPLPVRYAVLALDLAAGSRSRKVTKQRPTGARTGALAEHLSARLNAPVECRDAARLAAGLPGAGHEAFELAPAKLLDLLLAADALRRPERLDTLLDTCECEALSRPEATGAFAAGDFIRAALGVVRSVDAATIARSITTCPKRQNVPRADAIAKAVRAARL